ncbi:uridine kinase [Aedoeadaptatus coxii]|uniref:Uridine kinase n=1 Tax=Aedoeadaptatus coxii TaxID=755172 RepID=A0A134AFV8_9FIRM|nr:uridine kinase [Peptoniphilus coxii]KXB66602.1 uridine kinase [Peptoniphilus coxii]
MRPVLIGLCGGSGSGKSTVTEQLYANTGSERCTVIRQDNYYKDQSHLSFEDRQKTNYDHPFAFDNDLFIEHLKLLREGKSVDMPEYDFSVHNRKKETIRLEPKDIILIEGILLFSEPRILELLDMRIFVDTDSDVRILRRIKRDMKERARSLDSVIDQYMATVRPAHLQFVEPSKRYADIIVPEGGYNKVALDLIQTKVDHILNSRKK